MTAEKPFDEWIAGRYEELWPELFEPSVLEPAVSFLADLAGGGPALELGVGTGRVALPLSRRGVRVHGIESSPAMAARLLEAEDGAAVEVTIGDFATTEVDGAFSLAYLLRNTITNVASEEGQVATFRNVAAHLEPGGSFVIENYIPALRRIPPGERIRVFAATATHLGFEEYDFAAQIAISHHYWVVDGRLEIRSSRHRYLWPGELDLMARLAGLTLRERWADWQRTPFTSESEGHVSVWQKPPRGDHRKGEVG